jgi:hypothetical protein
MISRALGLNSKDAKRKAIETAKTDPFVSILQKEKETPTEVTEFKIL